MSRLKLTCVLYLFMFVKKLKIGIRKN